MEPTLFCQSCTMPIDIIDDQGTEKDGSHSMEYCKYCYSNGRFTQSEMTLEQMKQHLSIQMREMNLPAAIVQHSLKALPQMRRWKK